MCLSLISVSLHSIKYFTSIILTTLNERNSSRGGGGGKNLYICLINPESMCICSIFLSFKMEINNNYVVLCSHSVSCMCFLLFHFHNFLAITLKLAVRYFMVALSAAQFFSLFYLNVFFYN